MSLSIDDIFPCADQNVRILEPKRCTKYPYFPTTYKETDSRIIFRRRQGKGHSRFQYIYENLMYWEYLQIETFFNRKRGRYEDFYLVDWSRQYRITNVAGADYTLNSVSGLTDSAGYIGNTLLLYNPRYDVQQGGGNEDKNILTIDSGGIAGTTITVTKDQAGRAQLDTTNSRIYVLVPSIFDTDALAPNVVDICIDQVAPYFPGYGSQYMFGNITSITVPFMQLGISQE